MSQTDVLAAQLPAIAAIGVGQATLKSSVNLGKTSKKGNARMPYRIVPLQSGKFRVENARTGEVLSKHTTYKKAEAQVRLLGSIKHNPSFKPRNRFRGRM